MFSWCVLPVQRRGNGGGGNKMPVNRMDQLFSRGEAVEGPHGTTHTHDDTQEAAAAPAPGALGCGTLVPTGPVRPCTHPRLSTLAPRTQDGGGWAAGGPPQRASPTHTPPPPLRPSLPPPMLLRPHTWPGRAQGRGTTAALSPSATQLLTPRFPTPTPATATGDTKTKNFTCFLLGAATEDCCSLSLLDTSLAGPASPPPPALGAALRQHGRRG